MPALLLALLLMLASMPARAQEYRAFEAGPSRADGMTPSVLHVTDTINRHPVARAALKTFSTDRTHAGVSTKITPGEYRIGQSEEFKVYNVEDSRRSSDLKFDTLPFRLVAESARFRLWVETGELDNGHVAKDQIAALHKALSAQTPEGSIAPHSGILENDESFFGSPPNVDGDGVTDVLLVDIRDGYEQGSGYVAGFVWHGDLDRTRQAGNGRDVLYIDTYPGLFRDGALLDTRTAEATVAHEYQHLIHLGYDRDEATFVNEGLSEWAEYANGYADHAITYLSRPAGYNVGLLDWHDYETDLRKMDYQRAALFTSYLAQRLGHAALRQLIDARSGSRPLSGADGYSTLLTANGLSLGDVIADFHTANFLNDPGINPDFGYNDPVFQSMPVVPTRTTNGRLRRTDNTGAITLRPGGVIYLSWRHVANFQFLLERGAPSDAVRIRAIARTTDGRTYVKPFAANADVQQLAGDFADVTLAVIHSRPNSKPVSVSIEAVWEPGGTSGMTVESVRYDDGRAASFFSPSAAAEGAQATKFAVPAGDARLERVSIAPYFENQFAGTFLSNDETRDLDLRIWSAAPDGKPGEELLSLHVTDPRPFRQASQTLSFFDIDLRPYASVTANLPDTVFIGIVDAGDDANHLVAAASAGVQENVSHSGNVAAGTWKRLWDVQLLGSDDPYPMRYTAFPLRAEFVVTGEAADVPLQDTPALPGMVDLDQNYPNPFNPTTTITYHLEEASPVYLAVYDLMGRRVAVVEDGLRQAGMHQAEIDAGTWASGTYIYVLEAYGRREARKMTLIR